MEIRIATEKDMPSVFALRCEVFVKEQNVPPEIELDSEDAHALHVIAEENANSAGGIALTNAGGIAIGCARIIFSEDEANGKDAHIGRLAVKKAYRGKGIGAEICKFIIGHCRDNGCTRIWLNSQLHAVGFYEKLGFVPKGETFFEAGIEHIEMSIEYKQLNGYN